MPRHFHVVFDVRVLDLNLSTSDVVNMTSPQFAYAFVAGVDLTFLIPTDVAIPGDTLKPSS